jgi:hypothetical protein
VDSATLSPLAAAAFNVQPRDVAISEAGAPGTYLLRFTPRWTGSRALCLFALSKAAACTRPHVAGGALSVPRSSLFAADSFAAPNASAGSDVATEGLTSVLAGARVRLQVEWRDGADLQPL